MVVRSSVNCVDIEFFFYFSPYMHIQFLVDVFCVNACVIVLYT